MGIKVDQGKRRATDVIVKVVVEWLVVWWSLVPCVGSGPGVDSLAVKPWREKHLMLYVWDRNMSVKKCVFGTETLLRNRRVFPVQKQ